MNLKQFKFRLAATLQDKVEDGTTTRAAIEEAADTSKSRVQAWFAVEQSNSIRDNVRLPDAHDLHQLVSVLPAVGMPLLNLVIEGTGTCLRIGRACLKVVTMDEGLSQAIEHAERAVQLVKDVRAAMADKVVTGSESAHLVSVIDYAVDGLLRLRDTITGNTKVGS